MIAPHMLLGTEIDASEIKSAADCHTDMNASEAMKLVFHNLRVHLPQNSELILFIKDITSVAVLVCCTSDAMVACPSPTWAP